MKTRRWIGVLFIIGTVLLVGQFAMSEENERGWDELKRGKESSGVSPVKNELYQKECGACHFAYQPGLLPGRSWEKVMSGLSDHFGENAELSTDDRDALKKYLLDNAADRTDSRYSVRIIRSLDSGAEPDRITQIPYIVQRHHELGPKYVAKNPKVKSLSNCSACHRRAEAGSFQEREVSIPGFGRWDD